MCSGCFKTSKGLPFVSEADKRRAAHEAKRSQERALASKQLTDQQYSQLLRDSLTKAADGKLTPKSLYAQFIEKSLFWSAEQAIAFRDAIVALPNIAAYGHKNY